MPMIQRSSQRIAEQSPDLPQSSKSSTQSSQVRLANKYVENIIDEACDQTVVSESSKAAVLNVQLIDGISIVMKGSPQIEPSLDMSSIRILELFPVVRQKSDQVVLDITFNKVDSRTSVSNGSSDANRFLQKIYDETKLVESKKQSANQSVASFQNQTFGYQVSNTASFDNIKIDQPQKPTQSPVAIQTQTPQSHYLSKATPKRRSTVAT